MPHVSNLTRRLPRRTRGHRSKVSDDKKNFCLQLRNNPTTAYNLLWDKLRCKRLGYKFRRRAILYGWIVDFWCPQARVAIEIDYKSDSQRLEEHRKRDKVLIQHAIKIIRIPVNRVYNELDQVVRELRLEIN